VEDIEVTCYSKLLTTVPVQLRIASEAVRHIYTYRIASYVYRLHPYTDHVSMWPLARDRESHVRPI
jgi:hypothetical protein